MTNYQQKICTMALFLLVVFYFIFCFRQYTELFYEAQFLHNNFINDLVNGVFSPKNFFTTYGEHLFPGYNILLFVNYKLFKISSLFELVASILSMVAIREKCNWWLPVIIFALVLSPVQNIMWGMALAAHISTLLLVVIIYCICFCGYKLTNLFCISVMIPLYIIFFSGAYSIGFIAVLVSIWFFSDYQKDKKLLIVVFGMSMLSYIAYYLLLELYGDGMSNSVIGYRYSFLSIFGFIDLMFGSSLLGKAWFEKYQSLSIYYIAGLYVFCMLFVFFGTTLLRINNKIKSSDKYFILLCIYALANVVVVSVARNTNGAEGALGQWYQTHLKFIPITIACFLSKSDIKSKGLVIVRCFLLAVLILFLAMGYVSEYKKGPYVKIWKNNIKASIPDHLIHPEDFVSSSNSDPLLWDSKMVHDGLIILYKNNLSYFKVGSVLYSGGLTQDSWLEKTTDNYFNIICPYNSKSMTIQLDHINQHNLLLFPKAIKFSKKKDKYQITYNFQNEIKSFSLNVSKFLPYQVANSADLRKLLFHISEMQCI